MKVVFVLSVAVYATLGIAGLCEPMYVDVNSNDWFLSKLLRVAFVIAIVVTALYFLWFSKAFPKEYKRQKILAGVGLYIVFVCISLSFNVGACKLYNRTLGSQKTLHVKGLIDQKLIEKKSKGRKSFFIIVTDTTSSAIWTLRVKQKAFEESGNEGALFNKEFMIGSLGIIYRKDL
jgi:hypothetical protein